VPPSYGLRFGSTRPSRNRIHDRMHSTGAGGCGNRVCYYQSLCGVSPTTVKRCGDRERDGASVRVLTEPRRYQNCEGVRRCHRLRFGLRGRVVRMRPGRGRLSPRGLRLHEASPTGPWSPVSEPLRGGCGVLPDAILRCPGQKKCPFRLMHAIVTPVYG
jgi:hypothetical protein